MRTALIAILLLLPMWSVAAVFENPNTGERIRLSYNPADEYLVGIAYSKSGQESDYQSLRMEKTCDPIGNAILLCEMRVSLPNGGKLNNLFHNSANPEVVFQTTNPGQLWDEYYAAGSVPPSYAPKPIAKRSMPAESTGTPASRNNATGDGNQRERMAVSQWRSQLLSADGKAAGVTGDYMNSDASEGFFIKDKGSEKLLVQYQPPQGRLQPLTLISFDETKGRMILSHPSLAASEYVGQFYREPSRPRYLEVTFPDGRTERFYQISQ